MNRLKLLIVIFLLTTSLPLTFVIFQSYSGLQQEEMAQLRFFSTALFNQIEQELADLIQTEEVRGVDEYQHFLIRAGDREQQAPRLSPLAESEIPAYILGYLQNNPDGSMQTPLVSDLENIPEKKKEIIARLKNANETFNKRKLKILEPRENRSPALQEAVAQKEEEPDFAERFLKQKEPRLKNEYLGKKTQRIEEISAEQVQNIAREAEEAGQYQQPASPAFSRGTGKRNIEPEIAESAGQSAQRFFESGESDAMTQGPTPVMQDTSTNKFQVEVAPFQSIALQDDNVYVFRRIVIDNQIYRQGFILLIEPFLQHLIDTHFVNQPLAEFTALIFQRKDQGAIHEVMRAGALSDTNDFVNRHLFPAPFDFLSVSITALKFPPSPARLTLNVALAVLGAFMFLGLVAIYQSARSIVALSERRSQFVSSVTHELKTPLTNIRMYIEMLEQGIAISPEREQEYLAILGAESARLSSLINNVLELAKLEKKQRHFHLQTCSLTDVLAEVEMLMFHQIKNEGFSLKITASDLPAFTCDREVLIQILVNLIENCLKFGRNESRREITVRADCDDSTVRIAVSDTGPGIPRHALKKVFRDFYRVDNALTRTTGGTGIGLALVEKFVSALGGRVEAANNTGPGCTITLLLPRKK
ncbi:MAG: HAMP domain-containing sensor histidine kinase [Desulfopila sp.]|nr:HAMP domain-containing sensor histidine kinase [Desulfopila sp.]